MQDVNETSTSSEAAFSRRSLLKGAVVAGAAIAAGPALHLQCIFLLG